METTFLTIDGMQIAVHQSGGSGPAALFVHGNSASGKAFLKQLDGPLGAQYRLAAIDLPGHGMSDNASDPAAIYTLPGFARVVVEVIRTLGLEQAVLIGWSLGGHIVLEASADVPNAAGLLIFGTPPLAFPPDMAAAFLPDPAMGILFQETLNEEEVHIRVAGQFAPGAALPELFYDDIRRSDGIFRTTLINSLGTIGFRDEVQIVATLTKPLAVLHGEHERVVNGDYIAALAMPSLWRGAIQTIPGAGHSPFWETPEAFDALVSDFISEAAS
ncbi:MAG: alpha/beta hydrolase [Oscillochloris sp.]|nr:alpha/beta hydrolase [Oscillochloris sp.]